MKRADRILLIALGGKNDDVNRDVNDNMHTYDELQIAAKDNDNNSYDVDANLTLRLSLACNEKKNTEGGAQEGLIALRSTALEFMENENGANTDEGQDKPRQEPDLESPVAPLFSPLTPLVRKEKQTNQNIEYNEMSSPLAPMSPETLELFNTITTEHLINENDNNQCEEKKFNKMSQNLLIGDHSDFSADSDSEYNPNSESSSTEDGLTANQKSLALKKKYNNEAEIRSTSNTNTDFVRVNQTSSLVENDTTDCESTTNENYVAIESEIEGCQNSNRQGRPKKGRKRKNAEHTIKETKSRKYSNLPFYNSVKKYISPKQFRDFTCSCIRQCHLRVSREKREAEFQKYINLGSYESQILYIVNCVKEEPKKRAYTNIKKNTHKKRPKEFSRIYTLGGTVVCRNMFINNFGITTKKVDVSLKKNRSGNALKDKRGQLQGGWNKTSQNDIDFVKNIISSLPKYESHYRREQTNEIKYLKLGMTIQKIYDLYLEKFKAVFGEEKKPLSFAALKHIFYTYFNLRCRSLKKDTCTRCDTFANKIKNCSSNSERDQLNNEKENHLKKAEKLRKKMKEDLLRATSDEQFECLTFDLEKTLPLPRIPTSIVFYKRQLWLYNCGIHSGSDDTGHCYVWIEGEAGRGAQEVGSCLIKFIKNKLDSKVSHLVLWSDCCGGQNRNIKIVLMLKTVLNCHQTLQTITLKYLESGHTFLPNDTDFSKIESQLKYHQRIYTAEEYMAIFRHCKKRKPLQVTKMQKEDFLSSKRIETKIINRKTFTNKNKTNWLQTKEIMMEKEKKHIIYMKKDIEDEYEELNIQKKIRGQSLTLSENDFTVLWPTGKKIPQPKLEDLKSMFHLIPNDCIDFYKSLQGDSSLIDDIEGYGGEPDFILEDQEEHAEDELVQIY